jgi:hypothetical protein
VQVRRYRQLVLNSDGNDSDNGEPQRRQARVNMLSKFAHQRGPAGISDLIWDTGASEHLFEKLPENFKNLRSNDCNLLLGGSDNHKIQATKAFDVGCLRGVRLVDRAIHERVGYDIISAGRLKSLRTVQWNKDGFYVIDNNDFIVSEGVVGLDKIFYLTDRNLLLDSPPPRKVQVYVNVSLVSNDKMIHDRESTSVAGGSEHVYGYHLEGVQKNQDDTNNHNL